MRWGLGPVFIYECLTSSRRWQTYAARCFGVSVLLAAMTSIAWSKDAMLAVESMQAYAQLGESYFYALIGVELALVMLAAPAATAGAICLDRSRGTLAHMLATDLSDSEIVLGKLAARLLPVLGLVGCTWPVLAIASLLGGIDPFALTLAFAVVIAVAVVGCSMALALSVWARKPHEVVLVTYTFWIFVMMLSALWTGLSWSGLVSQPPAWADVANPFYLAFAPYANPGAVGFWEYLSFFAVTLGASVALAVLAIWRMRSVACRGSGGNGKGGLGRLGRLTRWMPGPSLDGNPVLWREWRRSRPSPWMVILLVLVGGSTGIACVVGAVSAWNDGVTPGTMPARAALAGIIGYELQVIFGLLMLSAVAPMSMSEEHQRGSLDILAATPLSSRTIVLGKWWGTFRLVPLVAIGPGLMAFALATAQEPPPTGPRAALTFSESEMTLGYRLFGAALVVATILAHGAAATSVGLAQRRSGSNDRAGPSRSAPACSFWWPSAGRSSFVCSEVAVPMTKTRGLGVGSVPSFATDLSDRSSRSGWFRSGAFAGGPHSGSSRQPCWPSEHCGSRFSRSTARSDACRRGPGRPPCCRGSSRSPSHARPGSLQTGGLASSWRLIRTLGKRG